MKNSLKIAVALTALVGSLGVINAETGGNQSAQEALERLMGIAKAMREHGPTWTAGIINGHQAGGTSSSRQGDTSESVENQQAMMPEDSESGIICVTNADGGEWKYSVHQLKPMLVGKSAVSGEHIWRDGVGIAMVEAILKEMRAQNTHKVSLRYSDKTPGVNEGREGQAELINKKLLAVNKSWLLNDNNPTGAHGPSVPGDVICATVYFQTGATDEGDFNRLTAPDMPDRHAAGATHPTGHKHHAKKAAAKDVKKEEPKKDEGKKDEPKKEETKVETKKEETKVTETKKEETKKEEAPKH